MSKLWKYKVVPDKDCSGVLRRRSLKIIKLNYFIMLIFKKRVYLFTPRLNFFSLQLNGTKYKSGYRYDINQLMFQSQYCRNDNLNIFDNLVCHGYKSVSIAIHGSNTLCIIYLHPVYRVTLKISNIFNQDVVMFYLKMHMVFISNTKSLRCKLYFFISKTLFHL